MCLYRPSLDNSNEYICFLSWFSNFKHKNTHSAFLPTGGSLNKSLQYVDLEGEDSDPLRTYDKMPEGPSGRSTDDSLGDIIVDMQPPSTNTLQYVDLPGETPSGRFALPPPPQ